MGNNKKEFLKEIINSKKIKELIITYSSKIVKDSKEDKEVNESIKSATDQILSDMESFGISISDSEIEYVKTNIEGMFRKQIPNSRMAEKIRNINPRDWNIKL